MRIGLFTDTYLPDINGVVSSTKELKTALESEGHTVFVITNHSGTGIVQDGEILRLPGKKLKMLYGYNLSSPLNSKANELIKEMDLDIVHLQTNFGVGIYGQRLARALHIPVVTTYHTMYEDYTHYINPLDLSAITKVSKSAIKQLSRLVCNHVSAVISPSQKTKDALLEYGVLAPIFIVPSGLDTTPFQKDFSKEFLLEKRAQMLSSSIDLKEKPEPVKDKKVLEKAEKEKLFLYLGRMAEEKELELLIKAFGNQDQYHLVLAGDGPNRKDYQELARKQSHPEKLHFLGLIQPEEVAAIYRAADAFVSASLSETQGITYLEALASGKMVFGRRDPVLFSLIEEGKTGFYFDDASELLKKCDQFCALSGKELETISQLCREKVAPYEVKAFGERVLEVYQQAIGNFLKSYKVEKKKEKDNFIELSLTHRGLKEPLRLWIPYEDYMELEIGSYADLEFYLVNQYLERQGYYKGLYYGKRKALSKDMSAFMLKNYLKEKLELSPLELDEILVELEGQGFINDENFAREQALLWHDMGYSKKQVSMRLIRKGIDSRLAQEAIEHLYSDVEEANAKALAKKAAKAIKNQSNRLKRQTVYRKLLSKGFEPETSQKALEELEWQDDENKALRQSYAKAKRLYSHLDGPVSEQKIKLYCLKKGFTIEDIDLLMEEDKAQSEALS